MNPVSLYGAFIITFSLLSYGIGSISLQRFRLVTKGVLFFLTTGIVLDVAAMTMMIFGSGNSFVTLHGVLGYSAFLVMLVDVIWIWKYYQKNGSDVMISRHLLLYSKAAYFWWVIAYMTGSLLIIWR